MTGQRYIDEVLLPHVRLFLGAVGDKFVYGQQRNMSSNTRCSGLSRQRRFNVSYGQRVLQILTPLKMCGMLWGGKLLVETIPPPTNKKTLIRALTEEWDKLPQQLLDNVVQSMVRRVECCITLHGGHIPY
ncbi:hypothetical protein TNCV_2773511 [Trichonephila clavipes]|nr:hypothetical protein TNCV_2773511 [Trichonephila clavipes]